MTVPSSAKILAVALAVACVAGCGGPGRQVGARMDDYEAYRRIRTAETLEQKLARSESYLRSQPEGRWRDDIREWYLETEQQYFERARGDASRLRRYLETLPRGPNATVASAELAEIEEAKSQRSREERAFVQYAQDIEDELHEASDNRRRLVREYARWIRLISAVRSFSKPTSELGPDFIFAFRNSDAPVRCGLTRCVRALSIKYAIPDKGRQSPRQAVMDVVIDIDPETGGVTAARLTGPDLFSRVGEAIQRTPVRPSDLQARAEAIGRAVQLAGDLASQSMPADRCGKDPIAPVVVERECDGARLEMVAAPSAEEEDRIEIRPTAGASP